MAALPHIDLWNRSEELTGEIRQASERTGLRISGLNPPGLDINISSADASMREWSVEMYIAIGRLASEVDARYLVVHPGRVPCSFPHQLTLLANGWWRHSPRSLERSSRLG